MLFSKRIIVGSSFVFDIIKMIILKVLYFYLLRACLDELVLNFYIFFLILSSIFKQFIDEKILKNNLTLYF